VPIRARLLSIIRRETVCVPMESDVVVVGGGSAGCALVSRLCLLGPFRVVLLEAGPDYGPASSGRWPAELLDPASVPATHQWGFLEEHGDGRLTPRARARVIGGCSTHNECGAKWPVPAEFELWAAILGDTRWGFSSISALLDVIEDAHGASLGARGHGGALPTQAYRYDRLASCQRAFFDACVAAGYPADRSSPMGGVELGCANIVGATRWNAAFAFLDPVRELPTLTIMDNMLVDRLRFEGRRATGVVCRSPDGIEHEVRARCVVLCAGTFGSPTILMRSGIGPVEDLAALGVREVVDLAGVGKNLQEHPGIAIRYAVDPQLPEADLAAGRLSHWQVGLDANGPLGARLAVFPYQIQDPSGAWETMLMAFLLNPASTGWIRLESTAPEAIPRIDPCYLGDPAGRDARALQESFRLLRRLAATEPLSQVLIAEADDSRGVESDEDIAAFVRENVMPYEHAACTCRMGRPDDPDAVTTADGLVRGVDNVVVADASIMPALPSVPINLTCMMIGWQLAKSVSQLAVAS
jgi:choline dehydrogenase